MTSHGSLLLISSDAGLFGWVAPLLHDPLLFGRRLIHAETLKDGARHLAEEDVSCALVDMADPLAASAMEELLLRRPDLPVVLLCDPDMPLRIGFLRKFGARVRLARETVTAAALAGALIAAAEDRLNDDAAVKRAFTDSQTGLPNRRLLSDRLNHAYLRAERTGRSFGVAWLKLNGVEDVLESYGAEACGLLVAEAVLRLTGSVRAGDTLARTGLDEFVILLEDLPDDGSDEGREATLRLAQCIDDRTFSVNGIEIPLRAVSGLAVYPQAAETPDELMKIADRSLYAAGTDRGTLSLH